MAMTIPLRIGMISFQSRTMSARAEPTTYTVRVPEDKVGRRLDRFLAEALPELSRTRLKALIEAGHVALAGGTLPVCDPARRVRRGDAFTVTVPPPAPATPAPQAIPLAIVYEDDDLLVIDKPAGLVVHPGPGNPDRTLVNALLAHCGESLSGVGGVGRPGIVHRLDKDTSGLIVVAKNDATHRALAKQFAAHSLERAYLAVVWGVPRRRQGEIAGNIARSPKNRKKMAVVKQGGKPALTRYRVLKTLGNIASLVECRLATGRTHQIRVHLASIGHPVIGDPVYGGGKKRLDRAPEGFREAAVSLNTQALHAYLIGFEHPRTHNHIRFESRLSSKIKGLVNFLE
jgi:23S rRNA pseudouridine1911/1915/1917 synthase